MAGIADIILQQAKSAVGGVEVPSGIQNTVINGLSQSVLGSLTQTVSKAGGIDQIKNLLSGKTAAAASPVTSLATNLFTKNVLSGLKLDKGLSTSLLGLVPGVMGGLGKVFKDKDGDGDVDFNDIIASLTGGSKGSSSLLGAAKGLLGSFLKK